MSSTTALPHEVSDVFLTDGGIETDLIFGQGIDLPEFASFVLLGSAEGEAALRRYFGDYLAIAADTGHPLVLETATWRANRDWGEQLGYTPPELRAANERATASLMELRADGAGGDIVVSGCIGPRGDAYADLGAGDPDAAEEYHREQIAVLAGSGVDVVTALTLTNVPDAVGIARAAVGVGIPVVLSFTVETDGRLPTGAGIADAIAAVDRATDRAPAYYMVNCAHHDHFAGELEDAGPALDRLRGVRTNASRLSHAELDEREDLDDGDPEEFGRELARLHRRHGTINVLGGCCGTDTRHIAAIASALATN